MTPSSHAVASRATAIRWRFRSKSQLIADDTVRKAAQVNDRANFDFVGKDAFDALIERHAKHGASVDRVFADKEVLECLRAKVLDQVYEEVTRE